MHDLIFQSLIRQALKAPAIKCDNPSRIVCFDLETTGFSAKNDEILQISALDGDGNVLINTYIKPYFHVSWPLATQVNHIEPEMVQDAPYIYELIPRINGIIQSAKTIVGYNHIHFDNKFISALGIKFPKGVLQYDVMMDYANYKKTPDLHHGGYRCYKLIEAAKEFGYVFNPHDSLEDAMATLYCFKTLQKIKLR